MSLRFSLAMCLVLVAGCGGDPPQSDAGAPDGALDASFVCGADLDCSDGLVCNGVEHCTANRCTAGAPMRCDDAIACTIDSCSEALSRCVFRVPDVDGDGAGDASCIDGTLTPLGTDCDDTNPMRFPGNTEQCDTAHVDEDCDPATLGGRDDDGDGFVSSLCCDGATCGEDCDDTRAGVHIGATEVCNGLDDDCDGMVDEGVSVAGFVDADRDGYGDGAMPRTACGTAVGFSVYGTDCDDASAAIHPGQPELCDGLDNDCDPATPIDVGAAPVTWYRDADGDGFGGPTMTMQSCAPPAGYSILGTDCDDTNAARSPASAERCNGIDDDCNGSADFVIAPGNLEDDDRDGIPDALCADPTASDCDDHDPTSGPGQPETCDGRDNDCDGRVDENASQVVFYRDADGDGFGASSVIRTACVAPAGYSRRGGDCDDTVDSRFPGALESCNAIDDDCDVAVDEGSYASASCASPHASSVCVVGTCQIVSCTGSYADCSASAPGCESDTRSEAANCGECGRPCAGTCTNGLCVTGCIPGSTAASPTNACAWGLCSAGGTLGTAAVVACDPIRIEGRRTTATISAGHRGSAAPVVDPCGAGQIAIGLAAQIDDASMRVFGLSVVCASLSVAGTAITPGASTLVPALGEGSGTSTTGVVQSLCPAGSALSGADVAVSSDHFDGLRAHCAPLTLTGTAAVGDFAAFAGVITNGATIGMLTAPTSIDCPVGQVSAGMESTATGYIHSMVLTCGTPAVITQTTTPVNGLGNSDITDCPVGQVPISMTADSTTRGSFYDGVIEQVQWGCAPLDVRADGSGGWVATVRATGGTIVPSTPIGCCYSSHNPPRTVTCPANQAIVGMSGLIYPPYGTSQVTIECAPITVTGDAATGFTVRYGTRTSLAPIGDGSNTQATVPLALCPQGTLGMGWGTVNGQVFDGVSLRCARPPIVPIL